jgi:large subunit ribosomal protein L17
MLRNMATSLVLHERIQTTLPKAKELRSIIDKMITLGKRGDLHARRLAASYLFDDEAVAKVFSDLATRFKDRPGGYTRILKTGVRFGDGASLATMQLVDFDAAEEGKSQKTADKAKAKEKKVSAKKKPTDGDAN